MPYSIISQIDGGVPVAIMTPAAPLAGPLPFLEGQAIVRPAAAMAKLRTGKPPMRRNDNAAPHVGLVRHLPAGLADSDVGVARARLRFVIMPLRFGVFIPMGWKHRVTEVVSLCAASLRMLAIRR